MRLRPAVLTLALLLPACADDGSSGTGDPERALTYYGDAKAVVDAKCATCHRPGDIGPFSLTTYEEVSDFPALLAAAIETNTMPPWQPADDCNSYRDNFDLTDDEKELLLDWLDTGAPAGDPADAPDTAVPEDPFEADLFLRLPEAYTPVREPDDYRCQLIPWPEEETTFVTGLRVAPDQRSIVHHVIVFVASPDQVAQFEAYDDAEEGPGYTCYGGPTASEGEDGGGLGDIDTSDLLAALEALELSLADVRSGDLTMDELSALAAELGVSGGAAATSFATLGSWVPGTPAGAFPPGTGIRMQPGSMLVAQMHYNTNSSAPVPDQSTIEVSFADSVEHEATRLGLVDIGWVTNGVIGGDAMTIPAGASDVRHDMTAAFDSALVGRARQALGLAADAPLVIHDANHHMHELGVSIRSEVRHADGSSTCVLDIPDWDFDWQGAYGLATPIPFRPGDAMWMGCSWDNTLADQPIIDGEIREPIDVAWGEGTSDEMCLSGFFVTGE